MNIFEQASRKKIRFISSRGDITVEDLWVMPLLGKQAKSSEKTANQSQRKNNQRQNQNQSQKQTEFSLDAVAKTCANQLKEAQQESIVGSISASVEKLKLESSLVTQMSNSLAEKKNKKDDVLATLELKMQIVKHVIQARLEEMQSEKEALERKQKRQLIEKIITERETEELRKKSPDELRQMIERMYEG